MNITSTVYDMVMRYLNNVIELSALEDWFMANLGEILELPPCPAKDLAAEVELGLSEISNGAVSEDKFKVELRALVAGSEFFTFGQTKSSYSISTGSSVTPQHAEAGQSAFTYQTVQV